MILLSIKNNEENYQKISCWLSDRGFTICKTKNSNSEITIAAIPDFYWKQFCIEFNYEEK